MQQILSQRTLIHPASSDSGPAQARLMPLITPCLLMPCLLMAGLMMALLMTAAPLSPAQAEDRWGGAWFTCEFARSQTPPDDDCAMFDDEGFRFSDGRFTYVRITESNETACRGEKVGQCFRRDRPAISIKTSDRGKLDLGADRIRVSYLFCTQTFYFRDTEHYREIWPDEDRCFWARKRHFYIARYKGRITERTDP